MAGLVFELVGLPDELTEQVFDLPCIQILAVDYIYDRSICLVTVVLAELAFVAYGEVGPADIANPPFHFILLAVLKAVVSVPVLVSPREDSHGSAKRKWTEFRAPASLLDLGSEPVGKLCVKLLSCAHESPRV